MRKKINSGFTLIEVMIVVAIIGILAAVAYPSFIDQVRKAKRSEATASALECAAILERRYTMRNEYESDDCDSLSNTLDDYVIVVTHPNACQSNGRNTCFLITVTPRLASSQASDTCTSFTLSDRGIKGATGGGADQCWRS